MKWAKFSCRWCGYTTTQLASAAVQHVCDNQERPLKRVSDPSDTERREA